MLGQQHWLLRATLRSSWLVGVVVRTLDRSAGRRFDSRPPRLLVHPWACCSQTHVCLCYEAVLIWYRRKLGRSPIKLMQCRGLHCAKVQVTVIKDFRFIVLTYTPTRIHTWWQSDRYICATVKYVVGVYKTRTCTLWRCKSTPTWKAKLLWLTSHSGPVVKPLHRGFTDSATVRNMQASGPCSPDPWSFEPKINTLRHTVGNQYCMCQVSSHFDQGFSFISF